MSRFWEKILTYTPSFSGTEEEADQNYDTHVWRVFRFHEMYDEASKDWPPVVDCSVCGVLADTERAKYACGAAPTPVKLEHLRKKPHR